MRPDENREPSKSGSASSKLADVALFASLAGVIVMLVVTMIDRRQLRLLNARVTQLEALSEARAAGNGNPGTVFQVNVADAPTKGADSAPVTIAEFAEFQCPFCLSVNPTLKRLEAAYTGKVRFVWKHMPLGSIHPHAMGAAIAAEAAKRQGKFWEYHDKLFANQQRLEPEALTRYAREVGLDVAQFEHDRNDPELTNRIEADVKEAAALSVSSTPTFFINGRPLVGAMPFESFAAMVDEELSKQQSAALRQAPD